MDAVTSPIGVPAQPSRFADGWYAGARRWPIHPGRLGGTITPKVSVVHTTDMAPGSMAALLRAWQASAGPGSGAHFLIGKVAAGAELAAPTGGLIQLAPITRNANHAGGSPTHGWYGGPLGSIHPNLVAVGIELDNAGYLRRHGPIDANHDQWVHPDSGYVIPTADVHVDERGRGWERITPYQLATLGELLDTLAATLPGLDRRVSVIPNGTYIGNGVTWAAMPGTREVGHVTLDPTRKTDPGPQVMAWLRARAMPDAARELAT